MKSLWNDQTAKKYQKDPLLMRVYTSQLLGQEEDLVLHGGGNTSVKTSVKNRFNETEDILYVKGSGWDLATIQSQGFAPVKMDVLLKMAELDELDDLEMVRLQRSAMIDPSAPNPSVEAILHAIIPFKYVDHTHADSVVTISNTPSGEKKIREVYGEHVLIVPYIMPGFILARDIYRMTREIDWKTCEGIVLLNHGIFTFDDDAKKSYEKMIKLVTKAENYLKRKKATVYLDKKNPQEDLLKLSQLRQAVSKSRGGAVLAKLESDPKRLGFSNLKNVSSLTNRGPLTPDHIIRTKRVPLMVKGNVEKSVEQFEDQYTSYFKRFANGHHSILNKAPCWAVWPGQGTVSFGRNSKECKVISDISDHTIKAIQQAEKLGGWKALPEKDLFEMEYWVLEQAKLKSKGQRPAFEGKVVLVTGAASGIGSACVEEFQKLGAAVVALDINPKIKKVFEGNSQVFGLQCDVTNQKAVERALQEAIRQFGGLDILVSNAGIFPAGEPIADVESTTWNQSLDINLSSHQRMLKHCIPYLKNGIDPVVLIVASKNVPAPGPGASAYSVAKAGLTQLARVAALELGSYGIRVNVIHPNQIFDTAIWTDKVLRNRAEHYNMSVQQYKRHNILNVEITSSDVAQLASTMAGPVFSKTTGAQVPIDGGNERVI